MQYIIVYICNIIECNKMYVCTYYVLHALQFGRSKGLVSKISLAVENKNQSKI